MKHFFLLAITLWVSYLAKSQNPFCGSDYLPTDPAAQALHDQLEQQAFAYFSVHQQAVADAPQAVLTIPMVVHIIHNNGPENISDAQVQQAIIWLNAAYANTGYFDQGSGTEVGIQFCLAQRTPGGLATNGITRDQNALTNLTEETQDLGLKNINRWEPKQYLNIWLVHDICSTSAGCGVVGYAYRPEYHGTQLDGLVIEAQFFGAVQSQMSVAAHEIGHYLGLYHTFEGGCTNNNCLIDGDRICDTPPDQSTAAVPCGQSVNTCSTDTQSGFTTDQPDMTSNFLDYGDINCFHDFTPGQAERMNFYLNGIRHSLLDSKGCLPPCLASVVSAFTPSATTVAPGQAVTFTNASQNAATYQWSINGQTFSTATTATYTFAMPGTYTVVLLAQSSNATLCDAAVSQVIIHVVCTTNVVSAFTSSAATISPGQAVTFTNASQNATTYQWLINGLLFSTVTNPSYIFPTSGTYTITLIAHNNAAFCNADTSQNVIQVACTVVANFTLDNQHPLVNQPITLTNTSQNATVFSWAINGVTQGPTLPTVTFSQAGIYIIQLTASNEGCQSTMQQQVLVRDSCKDETFQMQYVNEVAGTYGSGYAIATLSDGAAVFISKQYINYYTLSGFSMAKISRDGTPLWRKVTNSGIFSGYCEKIIATADDGFLLALNDDLHYKNYIAKFSTDGAVEWVQSLLGIGYVRIYGLTVNTNQEILIAGSVGTLNPQKSFFAKLGPSGNLLWGKSFSKASINEHWQGIAALSDGGLIGVGQQQNGMAQAARLDANGHVLWYNRLTIGAMGSWLCDAVQRDSSIYLYGAISYPDASIWLTKINMDGTAQWSKVSVPGTEYLLSEKQRIIWADNGLTVINPGYPAFLAHFDTSGTMRWNRSYSHGLGSSYNDIAARPGGYFIAGNIYTDTLNTTAPWLLKTDELGFAGTCSIDSISVVFINAQVSRVEHILLEQDLLTITSALFPMADLPATPSLLCERACSTIAEICNNNIDDDGDGLFDCLDPDCPCAENACQPNRNNHWYFGTRAGLDFSTEPPTLLNNGQTDNLDATATISDNQGNLLFYTDGYHIFNRFHQVMPQGTNPNLFPNQPRVTCMIIPYPGNPALYYVFIHNYQSNFYYALIDMRLDNGKGDVVSTTHFNALTNASNIILGMTATRSCLFDGYWLAIHDYTDQTLLAYRIDQNGLQLNPVASPDGDPQTLFTEQMKFSPSGKQLTRVGSDGFVVLYSFDLDFTQSGRFSNPQRFKVINSALHTRGVEYSPTGKYLYVSGYKEDEPKSFLYQFDLEAGSLEAIINSRVEIATDLPVDIFSEMQLAPNGKIYIANTATNNLIDVIHRPDAAGIDCQYQKSGLALPTNSSYTFGFSNCITSDFRQLHINFSPDAPDSICVLNSPTSYYIKNIDCDVDSIQWSLIGLNGTIVPNYQYANVTYLGPGQGQLIVTAYTKCGQAADTLPVTVHAGFSKILNLGPDRTVCDNGVFTFNAGSGFYRYRWQDGSTDSVLTTLLPGKYWVDVFDQCGNRQTDTVMVSIAPMSVLSLGPDLMQCVGQPVTFQRPDIFASWQWSPDTFLSCDTCVSVIIDPAETTTWTVLAHTSDGCLSLDTLHWRIVDTLFITREVVICLGQTIDLYGVSVPADTTVQFLRPSVGVGCDTLLTVHTLGIETPTATVETQVCPGQFFHFQDTLLSPNTTTVFHLPGLGCDSVVTVQVTAFPPATVSLPADTSLAIGASLTLNAAASGTGQLSFDWQPNTALSCDDCLQPIASPFDTITYNLLVTDENGCSARDSITLRITADCQILIPNAFTPNDDGVNDWFYPATFPCVRHVRLWRVVNRWGEVVFERRNFEPNQENLGWDGKGQPSEVFVWMAELEYFDGRIEQRKGEVTLLR